MSDSLRKTGIAAIGDVPWGTHFCQFYKAKQDLLDVLVPYFTAGLENGEYCMWVTAEPLERDEARAAMSRALPDLDRYLQRGQLEILPYGEWYLRAGAFDSKEVLSAWAARLERALSTGYEGLRLTGNTFWLEKKDWKAFTDYEEEINRVIGSTRMIALCTYSLERCGIDEVLDVVKNHQFALIERQGRWELIESSDRKRVAESLDRQNAILQGINRLFRETLSSESEEELGRVCLAVAEELTSSTFGFIGELHPEGRLVDLAISDPGWEACRIESRCGHERVLPAVPVNGLYGRVIRERRGFFTNAPASEPDSAGLPEGHPSFSAFLGAPLVHGGKLFGMAGLGRREGGYRPEDLQTLEALAPAIVQVFMRKRGEQALHQAKQLAEAGSRAKTEFLAHMSHEIRTPISAVIGLAEVLLTRIADAENHQFVSMIRDSARSLLSIIGNILDLSRIESGKVELHIEDFDLHRMLESLVSTYGVMAKEKNLNLDLHIEGVPPLMRGDAEMLSQVLRNLLSNAIKYTEHGSVGIDVRVPQGGRLDDGLRVRFAVEDTGIGIPAGKRNRLFESFSRVHDSSVRITHEGAGLGLAIARRLVALMGGEIGVESDEGRGSTFWFEVDLGQAQQREAPDAAAKNGATALCGLPRLKVLLAEDNRTNRRFLQIVFEDCGHSVVAVADGSQAVEAVQKEEFDVVLMDVQMPVLDGLAAARQIRALEGEAARIPIIALTAFAMRRDEERCLKAGMNGYVTKPVNLDQLAEEIRRFCL